ncbi:ATP-dependent helicase HrpB [Streptomyces sp. TRM 70351]|uniref:ATP-dependent helicase HrpB n=1 Tax=Streptomyces sp. TRM 70351 TaxID=3116552 RepID=UPI002E7B2B8E|nr:ATP-dependent helicase HrpB [Streptomyces sp. TRM 70351]MEE1930528.1 ATP-dependent helicase HrpB [Streptomyces sp. TRM 70351]
MTAPNPRTEALDRLPVRSALPALRAALDTAGTAVLCAPPGTGKTTLVPLVLAGLVPGAPAAESRPRGGAPREDRPRRVLVAEPRRIAARAAARRMAWLLGEGTGGAAEEPGHRVGYTVRGERRVGRQTVVEVVTTGVLLQRLQRDPELPGVDVVILDECHERHLDADTAAAFLLDVRATLRPGLHLVAASATTDAAGWARLLDASVVEAEGVSHPVEVVWAPPPVPVPPPHGTRVDRALLAHVAATVRRALAERGGDVLCFLPGVGEIAAVAGLLGEVDADVLQVHGRAGARAQDAVFTPGERRRVVLATAVAESSLTVPGVRTVVDCGLAREPRTDHARGLSALTTVYASRAAARQRAGRAGREAPGTVYRCWAEAQDARRPRFPTPEIAVADLGAFALQAACWGDPEAAGLALLDPPPAGAMAAAREVLTAIGAVDAAGRATARGTAMARLGLHPRLARALLDGARLVGARAAAEVVALLSEEPPRELGADVAGVLRAVRRERHSPYAGRWRRETERLCRAVPGSGKDGGPQEAGPQEVAGLVVALAHPERVAARQGGGTYLMASGTRAEVPATAAGSPWLAVAVADRPAGAATARARLVAPVDAETARQAAAALYREDEEVAWDPARRRVTARRVTRLGAVELDARQVADPDPARVRAALLDVLRTQGLGLLRWSPGAVSLRRRVAFLHRELGEPWPDVGDAALLARADTWLTGARPGDVDTLALLRGLLPWAGGEAARLEELAPERVEVPSGSRVRVDYSAEQPVLAVRVQELFGWARAPRLADGRVPLLVHLLSPAGRPVAVTADLASFWADGYRAVRAELRGRYPRHPWPEDPATAQPTRRTNRRR